MSLSRLFESRGNSTAAADVVTSLLATAEDDEVIDFGGLTIVNAYLGTIDFARAVPTGLTLSGLAAEMLVMPERPITGVEVRSGIVDRVVGVTTPAGMPEWVVDVVVGEYSSVQTNSSIRAANLPPANQILATIIRKTFFQRGSARKESALFRGLGQLDPGGVTTQIVGLLCTQGIIERVPGREGALYRPIRKYTRRMGKMLAALNLSDDPLWMAVRSF